MNKIILIIDDDEKLNALLIDYLAGFNYTVSTATLPSKGLRLLEEISPTLVILDIMLPEMDGFAVCRKIRKQSAVPIIMLTARGDVTDRVVGLEMGADDYLPKPFEPRELVARIQTVLRRAEKPAPTKVIQIENLKVDLEKYQAVLDDITLDMTTMEFELLALFIQNPGRVLSRDFLMDSLRGMDWQAYDRSIDVAISRLRQKLKDDPKHPKWIRTVRSAGYQFVGDLDEEM